jgi:hypothetical protein
MEISFGTGRTAVEARIRNVAPFTEGVSGRIIVEASDRRTLDLNSDIILWFCEQPQRRVVESGAGRLNSFGADACKKRDRTLIGVYVWRVAS